MPKFLPFLIGGVAVLGLLALYNYYPSREVVEVTPLSTTFEATFPTTTVPQEGEKVVVSAPKPVVVQTPTPTPVVTPPPQTPTPKPIEKPKPEPEPEEEQSGKEFKAYITGYSYWDNTPAGSPEISNGVIHDTAGGKGTYKDPITVAVGHTIDGRRDILDYDEGTIFYFPHLRKYGIVEDTCGDGNKPQEGPCHTGYHGYPWLDIYVGGDDVSESTSEECMDDITDIVEVIEDPGPNYPVEDPGPLSESGCEVY
jgi:hypothetical protein